MMMKIGLCLIEYSVVLFLVQVRTRVLQEMMSHLPACGSVEEAMASPKLLFGVVFVLIDGDQD